MVDTTKLKQLNTLESMAKAGKSDKDIAKATGIADWRIGHIIGFLGLVRARRKSIFSDFRKLYFSDYTDRFSIPSFSIPPEEMTKIGLKAGSDYKVTAHAERGSIRLEIIQMA